MANRILLRVILAGFVVLGMADGLMLAEVRGLADLGRMDASLVAALVGFHLIGFGVWFGFRRYARRYGPVAGMDAALWVAGPLLAYLVAGATVYLLCR